MENMDSFGSTNQPTSITMSETWESSNSVSVTKGKKYIKDLLIDRKETTASTLFEYRWPQDDDNAEDYMLQEQVSDFLGITSFRRKYPDIIRRVVDMEEKDYLHEQEIVTMTQMDLGLIALNSSDVKDIMCDDFPEKYEEYLQEVNLRKYREIKENICSSMSSIVRGKSTYFTRNVIQNCAKWNTKICRERKKERAVSFNSQNNVMHYPAGKFKVLPPEATKVGRYPIAIMTGQYCDSYKTYTSEELKCLPLNTVLMDPVLPDEAIYDVNFEGLHPNSEKLSAEPLSTSDVIVEPVMECNDDHNVIVVTDKKFDENVPICQTCEGDTNENKDGFEELLITCNKCGDSNHPSCLELTLDMVPFMAKYNWVCADCKSCVSCDGTEDEDKMAFCDLCDRGYHIYCVGLRKVPGGRWHCMLCSVCHSCGATEPSLSNRMAVWHHQFKKEERGVKYFTHSYCVPCNVRYKKGHYCPNCLKCHLSFGSSDLLECCKCEKWVHKDCATNRLPQISHGFLCNPCEDKHRHEF